MTNPRTLGIKDGEIIAINRDLGKEAREVVRLYYAIMRDPENDGLKNQLLDALLVWRDSLSC